MSEHTVPWWSRPQRVLQPILRTCDAGVDMQSLVDTAVQYGFTAILQNVGGMVAWYPTNIPYHERVHGMRGDPLGELIEAAHKKRLRVMARFDLSGLREDAYAAHPEWFYRGRNGKPMIDKGMYATCLSTGFLDDFFFPMFEELLSGYAIDGVFFNMFGYRDTDRRGNYHGPCHCPACQEKFYQKHGKALPANQHDPQYLDYLTYKETMFEAAARRVYEMIKAKDPAIAFLDGRGRKATHSLLRGLGDVAEVELHWMPPNPRKLDAAPRYSWPYAPGEGCRYVRTLGPEKSTMVNIFQCGAGRLIGHSVGWNTMAVAQTIANGGWPYIAFTGTPWMESTRSQAPLKSLLTQMQRNQACFEGLVSMAKVALLTSDTNLDANPVHSSPEGLLHDYRGWYQALVQTHTEFDVLDELQLDEPNAAARLAKYDLLIVPPIAMMGDKACQTIDAFVSAGGNAIICGEAGFYHKNGSKRSEPAFASVGIDLVVAQRNDVQNAFFHVRGESSLPSLAPTNLLAVNGGMVYVKLRHGAVPALPMEAEIEYASPEQECFESTPGHPGLVFYAYGKGRTAYLTWSPARLSHLYGQEDHCLLLQDLIAYMQPPHVTLATDAPECVEITAHFQPSTGNVVVQFVNHSGHDGVAFHKPLLLRDLHVTVHASALKGAHSESGNLQAHANERSISFTLPSLETYALVVLTP